MISEEKKRKAQESEGHLFSCQDGDLEKWIREEKCSREGCC